MKTLTQFHKTDTFTSMSEKEKLFVVRKYIKALSAADAISKDPTSPVDEIYVDSDWKSSKGGLADALGFNTVGEKD